MLPLETRLNSYKIDLTTDDIKLLLVNKLDLAKYEFCFSLYKNDFIQWKDENNQVFQYRFLSRNLSNTNMIEVKPIEKAKYEKRAEGLKTLKKGIHNFYKISVDVLGYQYFIKREILKLSFEK